MKSIALCAVLLSSAGVARAASEPAKTFSVDFTLTSSGPANGVFLGSLTLKGTRLSGTLVSQSFGYIYTISPGSTLKARVLKLTCALGSPVTDMITLSGTLSPLSGKGKGTFTESFFSETGPYTAKKAP